MTNPNVIALFANPQKALLTTQNIAKAHLALRNHEHDEDPPKELLEAIRFCGEVDGIITMFRNVWSRVLAPKVLQSGRTGLEAAFGDCSLKVEVRRGPHCVATISMKDDSTAIFFANLENGKVDFLGGGFDSETLGDLIAQIVERADEILPTAQAFG